MAEQKIEAPLDGWWQKLSWLLIGDLRDLRDRVRLLREAVCEDCGCAPAILQPPRGVCVDCQAGDDVGASVSVGLRALAGRKLLRLPSYDLTKRTRAVTVDPSDETG